MFDSVPPVSKSTGVSNLVSDLDRDQSSPKAARTVILKTQSESNYIYVTHI